MAVTLSTKAYNQDRISPDSIVYAGPAQTLSVTDQLVIGRVYPKPVGDFGGMARPSIRLVRTVTLGAGPEVALASLTITGALPVGISGTDIDSLIADAVDMLQLEEAGTTKVSKNLDITY